MNLATFLAPELVRAISTWWLIEETRARSLEKMPPTGVFARSIEPYRAPALSGATSSNANALSLTAGSISILVVIGNSKP